MTLFCLLILCNQFPFIAPIATAITVTVHRVLFHSVADQLSRSVVPVSKISVKQNTCNPQHDVLYSRKSGRLSLSHSPYLSIPCHTTCPYPSLSLSKPVRPCETFESGDHRRICVLTVSTIPSNPVPCQAKPSCPMSCHPFPSHALPYRILFNSMSTYEHDNIYSSALIHICL